MITYIALSASLGLLALSAALYATGSFSGYLPFGAAGCVAGAVVFLMLAPMPAAGPTLAEQ